MGKVNIARILNASEPLVSSVNDVVQEFGSDLDDTITEIEDLIANKDDLTIEQLNYYIAYIPIILYRISDTIGDLGVCADLAKQDRRNKYNDAMLASTKDTVSQRTSDAQSAVSSEQIIEDVYARAYKKLQHRMEHAESLHSSLKKILNYRISELEVTRTNTFNVRRIDRM